MKRSACIILVLIVSSYPKVRASIHDISMFRGYTTKDKKKNKVDKDAFIYHIPAGKKGVGDSGCKFERSPLGSCFCSLPTLCLTVLSYSSYRFGRAKQDSYNEEGSVGGNEAMAGSC